MIGGATRTLRRLVQNEHVVTKRRTLSSIARGVPVIDVSELISENDSKLNSNMKVCQQIEDACSTWGFFQCVNAPIDPKLQAKFYDQKERFFHLPTLVKEKIRRTENNSKGWYDDELTKQRRDWKEGFDIGAQDGDLDKAGLDGLNQWPNDMDDFENIVREYFQACESFARSLTCAMTVGLGLKPEALVQDHFDSVHSSYLRMNYYPKCPEPESHMAISHHTDAGAVTVLTQSLVQSLQVYQPHDDKWYDVEPIDGAFVINTGDIMQVWSNDKYRAPLHRVKAQLELERYSSPFFYNPSYETNYAPVYRKENAKYRPINWGEFRMKRFAGDYADVGEEVQISHYALK